jgi:murein DD-endopeptidase MepM/ murein hydrolase activator NlpD
MSHEDWYCYGADLIAVGDGVISAVHDGVQDNYPVGTIIPLTNETIAGNHVMIKLADRQYAVYGHMIPGSIKVKVGDIVKKGDVLGKLGNTGRSDVPHLHFQISDSTSLFDIEGLPYVFSEFELEAYSEMLWAPRFQDISIMNYQPVIPPKKHYNELIERYMIIRFY